MSWVEGIGQRLTVATLNTRGVPVARSQLPGRFAAIAGHLEASDIDVVNFQEVCSYWHLSLLARRMPSFRAVSYRRSAAGPAGGLVTLSRWPAAAPSYRGFGRPGPAPGVPLRSRAGAGRKGVLVTRLADRGLWVVNTHLSSNRDGDWSAENRFYPLHRSQLAVLTRMTRSVVGPVVLCGDFNIDRDSSLFGRFLDDTELADAFAGRCPATFHGEFLDPGEAPHCIDFILTSALVRAEATRLLFRGREPVRGQLTYLSDHIGLCASLASGSVTDRCRRPAPHTAG